MHAISSDIFLYIYYATGVGMFVLALVPLVLIGFFVFSMLPSMLFSRFYDRMYKRLGFMPEITLFLICCGLSATLTANVLGSPPLCLDPLTPKNPPRLSFYQVTDPQGAPLRTGEHWPSVGLLPYGTILYSPLPQTSAFFEAATPSTPVTRAVLPLQKQATAISGVVSAAHIAPGRFLEHPFAFAGRQCKPAFLVDWRSLLRWPWG